MNKLRLGLLYLQSKSELEINLLKILCAPSEEVPRNEHVRPILIELEEVIQGRTSHEKSLMFIKKLESLKHWDEVMKLLLIAHRAINEGALTFLTEFTIHDFKNIHDLANHAEEKKAYNRCLLAEHYFKYLKTYSEHYFTVKDILLAYKHGKLPILSSKSIKDYTALTTILQVVSKTEDKLCVSIDVLGIPIVKEMGKMILLDAVHMYNALKEFVSANIPQVFELDEDTALQLDDLYCDLIRLTKKIDSLYEMKHNFNDFRDIKAPELYQFDRDFNKKEELFVYDIRKRRKPTKDKKEETVTKIRTVSSEEPVGFPTDDAKMDDSDDLPVPTNGDKKGYMALDNLQQIEHEFEDDNSKLSPNSYKYKKLVQSSKRTIELENVEVNID